MLSTPVRRARTLSRSAITLGALIATGAAMSTAAVATATPRHEHTATVTRGDAVKPTIVLVHGAWADASSFERVTARLQADGYTVRNAPNTLRGVAIDAANVAAFITQATTGPVVLVGHSAGGTVITNAGLQAPTVKALVYIDAFAPAQGETVLQLSAARPGSSLAVKDPSTVLDFVRYAGAPAGDVDTYVKPALFGDFFAPQLPKREADVLAADQSPVTLGFLSEPSKAPAWSTLKSYFFVGTRDKIIPPAEQLAMARRAHGTIVERPTDHLSMREAPKPVSRLIEQAAEAG
jgi:pimeloyl-ACP methyl ester carboxylesterase